MTISFQHDSFVILKGYIRRIRAQRACKEIKNNVNKKYLPFFNSQRPESFLTMSPGVK